MNQRTLLWIDAIVNIILGLLLLFFPVRLAAFLGIPVPAPPFYASLLGGVLFGIGLALLMEVLHERVSMTGLGIGGAIAINLCGAGALAFWLLFGSMDIPLHGRIFLWSVAGLVFVIAILEISLSMKKGRA